MIKKYKRKFNSVNGFSIITFNNKVGFINNKTDLVIGEIKYDYAENFKHHIAIVGLDGVYNVIDEQGKELLDNFCDHIWINNGYIIFESNEKYGVIDHTGKIILPLKYDFLYIVENWKPIIRKHKLKEIE